MNKLSSLHHIEQAPVIRVQRIKHHDGQTHAAFDQVICEEPLQISLNWFDQHQNAEQTRVFTITMRTPGDDMALTRGLLFSEGLIKHSTQIKHIGYDCDNTNDNTNDNTDDNTNSNDTLLSNQLTVQFIPGFIPHLNDLQRGLISQSSCGICGKTSLKSLELKVGKALDNRPGWLDPRLIKALPKQLQAQQPLFAQTGGVHGAALFDQDHRLLMIKEDIGRHNAVDKVIGEQLPACPDEVSARQILLVSGRVSFELVQKAVIAGYPVLVAVGAPSSLAITAAQRFDLTLIGFTKPDRFNVYHGQWRINDKVKPQVQRS